MALEDYCDHLECYYGRDTGSLLVSGALSGQIREGDFCDDDEVV